ncbi:dipeptide ABC transporter ATP-binding protein [Nesterenkonia muleiensis]|uniref:dipeptide ABC transporter ATP-binding protein n=1 Tax=Nesterenkonia muleiensis TaxID=2282648 RepID=UPI000E71835E|nr:ABC transporter ATP-binding protein [Nesterenkonia muleiensis]
MTYSLEFDSATIGYRRRGVGVTAVVEEASLTVDQGQTLALVGQSGSGKSSLAAAAVGLLARNGQVLGGDIRLNGESVLGKREKDWRKLRGELLGYIPQDPLSSLDPVQKIGSRLINDIRLHRRVRKAEAHQIAGELLDRVGIRDPQAKLASYPHELSGGQLQRILIALAVSGNPRLLIADEPTSALDVTVQRTILELLDELKDELGLSVLLITHDLALATDHSDDLAVINKGRIVDYGPVEGLLAAPGDEYTKQLFEDVPALSPERYEQRRRRLRVKASEGLDAELADLTSIPAVEVKSLRKTFPGAGPPVLVDVDLSARAGDIHALVGESGSGKTTLARIVAGLTSFDSGTVRLGEEALENEPPSTNPRAQRLQLVYQNPLAALDPRFTVRRIIEEPLVIHQELSGRDRREKMLAVLDQVALGEDLLRRRPAELSGGQRQRVAIARALVNAPDVLVLDEPTSALDVTVQRQIVDVLVELQEERGLTYLFISHDLSLVRQIADRVTVLEQGRVVEDGSADQLFGAPQHPYTQKLIEAVPGQKARTLVAA